MKYTELLNLPIFDNPETDKFRLDEWNNGNINIDNKIKEFGSSLEHSKSNINDREVNIIYEKDYDVNDISIVVNRLSNELYTKGGGVIFVPVGTHYYKSQLYLRECVTLKGVGNPYSYTGNVDKNGTLLVKNGTFTDVSIKIDNTAKLLECGVSNISISNGSGIQLYGNKSIAKNVTVSKFNGDGVIVGDMIVKRNCNSWNLENVFSMKNKGRGFVIDTVYAGAGPDTNAGLGSKCGAWGNEGDGWYLGDSAVNTFLQCYSESNLGVGWRITSKCKRSFILGCGAEQNTIDQFLFESGSSNNMYFGTTEFTPTDNGANMCVTNTGGAVQKLHFNKNIFIGEKSGVTAPFTGGVVSNSNLPGTLLYDRDGETNKKYFDSIVNGGALQYRVANDGGVSPTMYRKTIANGDGSATEIFNCNIGTSKMVTGSTLGTVIRKLPICDVSGNIIGYIPVYNTIT